MSKKILIATIALLSVTNSFAQDMRTLVREMPDSIIPTLTLNDRLDFIDYLGSNMKAEVTNRLGGKSEMTTIGETYTHIRMSGSSELSMKLLPFNGDSIICMVRTYSANGSDSKISFYTKEWEKITDSKLINIPSTNDFLVFPDSVSSEERNMLTNKLEIPLIKAILSEASNEITFTLTSQSYLNKDDRKAIEPYIKKSIVKKWNNRYE